MIYVALSLVINVVFFILFLRAKRESNKLKEHLNWSYDQHKNSLDSILNLTLNLTTAINSHCKCKDSTHDKTAYGIEELIKARKEWIATQWKA